MKKVFIMRGIPGSGKSTCARELSGAIGTIHSTDNYFIGADGQYSFDPLLLKKNHERNLNAFCNSVRRGKPIVICDNTNMCHHNYYKYILVAKSCGYEVKIICMPHIDPALAAARSVHNVPIEAIERMLARWEP